MLLAHGTGFLLARLGTLAERSWSTFLREQHLTQTQYAALTLLQRHDALGQGRLAQLLGIDARNLVAVVDALITATLVERAPHPSDGRRRVLTLTPTGRDRIQAVTDAAAGGRDEFLIALDAAERAQLNALLYRVYDHHVREPTRPG